MNQMEEYKNLKKMYEESKLELNEIYKKQSMIMEKLKEVCPHEDTSKPFLDELMTMAQVKVCNVCHKTLYYNSSKNEWS